MSSDDVTGRQRITMVKRTRSPSKRGTRSDWSAMRSDWNREATIGELLSDPMMEAVLRYARTTPEQLRTLMREVAAHRGKVGTDEKGENAI
jgi:hypothetical protein